MRCSPPTLHAYIFKAEHFIELIESGARDGLPPGKYAAT